MTPIAAQMASPTTMKTIVTGDRLRGSEDAILGFYVDGTDTASCPSCQLYVGGYLAVPTVGPPNQEINPTITSRTNTQLQFTMPTFAAGTVGARLYIQKPPCGGGFWEYSIAPQ